MIRFADSCSWATGNALTGAGASAKYTPQRAPFPNANFGGGRYGGFSYLFNVSAGGPLKYVKPIAGLGDWVYDSRSFVVVNGYDTETIFYRYQDLLGNNWASVSLDATGHIRIYSGGNGTDSNKGTLLYRSQAALVVGTWYSVDMAWNFPSAGLGQMSLYINDVLDTATTGQPSVIGATWGASGQPTAFALCWGNNSGVKGIAISDIVVSDNTGSYNTGRLGPMRVGLYIPYADAQPLSGSGWLIAGSSSATTGAAALGELPGHSADGQAPDGDYSYITSTAGGSQYLATPGRRVGASVLPGLDCYGGILGIAVSACLREPAQLAQDAVIVPNPSTGTPYTLGLGTSPAAYGVVQVTSEVRPDTLTQWTDGEASTAWWGAQSSAGTPALTQLVLEKITTTRNLPYNCGGLGSYTYAG